MGSFSETLDFSATPNVALKINPSKYSQELNNRLKLRSLAVRYALRFCRLPHLDVAP